MAPFGTLYTYAGNGRSTAIRAVAKANNLELDIVETDPSKGVSADYLKINKLGKVPTLVCSDGYTLHECMAIAIYITSQNERTTLLGKTKQDYASMLKWMSFFNTEVLPTLGGWFRPLLGLDPYNKKNVEDSQKSALKAIKVVEEHLLHNTYLVGERVSLADLFAVGMISRGFQFFFDRKWRAENPNVARWYETVYNQPIYSAVADKFNLLDEPLLKNQPPKKPEQPKKESVPKAPKAPKAEPKPKPKEVEDEEEEDIKEPPKPKHPLEALPKPVMALDEWKRQYSNNETPVALKWFWENHNPEEYSLWKVVYKFPEDLTQVFMSSNLIGGFFARLEASRKYIFGSASVYGETNDSTIEGAFLIRGQNAIPAFDVAPDFESYEFTKLDPTKPVDKEYVNDQWTWEKPINFKGKEYQWAAGKIFK